MNGTVKLTDGHRGGGEGRAPGAQGKHQEATGPDTSASPAWRPLCLEEDRKPGPPCLPPNRHFPAQHPWDLPTATAAREGGAGRAGGGDMIIPRDTLIRAPTLAQGGQGNQEGKLRLEDV